MPNGKKASNWYEKWHENDYHFLAHWGIFIIIVVVVWAFLYARIGNWIFDDNEAGITVTLPKSSTQLYLEPKTKTIKQGDVFTVNVMLDTGKGQVDGVDLYALHYDPSLLQVIDDIKSESGTQITPGNILTQNTYNQVDTKAGNIKFAQVAEGGTSFNGKGVLATVHFKALAPGSAYLKFDFTAGSTIDSNAAYRGKDQLNRVVDAIYTIEAKE
jgi:hypothetical protein